jgi:hypothetical protein
MGLLIGFNILPFRTMKFNLNSKLYKESNNWPLTLSHIG